MDECSTQCTAPQGIYSMAAPLAKDPFVNESGTCASLLRRLIVGQSQGRACHCLQSSRILILQLRTSDASLPKVSPAEEEGLHHPKLGLRSARWGRRSRRQH